MMIAGFVAVLAALDLFFKAWIEAQQEEEFPRRLFFAGKWLKIQKIHNRGLPFGVMSDRFQTIQTMSLVMTSAVAGALACLAGKRGNRMEKLGLCLVLGGALSNLYDRLVRKYVVDYVTIEIGKLKKVVFNLGDMFVLLGSLLLYLTGIIGDIHAGLVEVRNRKKIKTTCKKDRRVFKLI